MQPSSLRLLTVFGFNLGVEGAQLVAMLCAVPMLFVSPWPVLHKVRVTTRTAAAAVARGWSSAFGRR